MGVQVQHRARLVRIPFLLGKAALRLAVIVRVQQHLIRAVEVRKVKLVLDHEGLNSGHQRVPGLGSPPR